MDGLGGVTLIALGVHVRGQWKIEMKCSAVFGMTLVLLGAPYSIAGDWVDHTIRSTHLAGNLVGETPVKDFVVYLPDAYTESQAELPVIYWFPGINQVNTWMIDRDQVEEEFRSGRADPAILVFMPVRTSFASTTYLSSEAFGDWEAFLSDEVIPLVDSKYRTKGTPDQRGIMGFSLGGFASLTLPLLMPDTFGAVGANDPALGLISGLVRTVDELPPDLPRPDTDVDLGEFFDSFPESIDGFKDAPDLTSLYGQIAARFAPNPDHPLQGELPFDRDGQWNPDARRAWREFDLLDPDSVELHRDALDQLASFTVTLPDQSVGTAWTKELLRVYQAAGLPIQGIDVPGDHNDNQYDRFRMLLSNVSYALSGENRTTIAEDFYHQNFNRLGSDESQAVDLPAGWSVTDEYGFVFRDRTNTPYRGGNVELVGEGPFILNVGDTGGIDRALGIHAPPQSGPPTIQFLTDLSNVAANKLDLQFNLEITGDGAGLLSQSEAALLDVVAELDFGEGVTQIVPLGQVSANDSLGTPIGIGVDAIRFSFSDDQLLPQLPNAEAIRILWTPTLESQSSEWVLALDDVELAFDLLGDFDADEMLTGGDIDLLSVAVRNGGLGDQYDLSGDGTVDALDREHWVRELVGTEFGDLDLDREVGFPDFLILADRFGEDGGWADGDFDGSGVIDFADLLLLVNNFGEVTSSVAAVPEPESWITMTACLAWLGLWRFRTRA